MLDRVRQIRPVALHFLLEGLDTHRAEWTEDIPCKEPSGITDENVEAFNQWNETTFVLGIAIGLLLRPEAIEWTPGGER